jgi:hypothetical protein
MVWDEETIRKGVTFPILRDRMQEAKIRSKDLPNPRLAVLR